MPPLSTNNKRNKIMSFPTITVYGDSDNAQRLRLLNNNEPANLKSVTRVLLELDDATEIDSDSSPGLFEWSSGALGVLTLFLGRKWWRTRIVYSKLVVFDELNTRGVFWGMFRIRAIENTSPTS